VYATVRIYESAAGLADAVAGHRGEILALFEAIPGFRGYHIVKTGPESAVSITIFDDQVGAEASNQAARDWIAANLAGASISPPQVLAGDVAMSS
jgi:heme-degrading monooxygenase HmoA